MSEDPRPRPPMLYRGFLRAASWLVPARARAAWHAKWHSVLSNAWILKERGELERSVLVRCGRDCLSDVLYGWITTQELRREVHSPRLIVAAGLLMLAMLALFSHGFAGTRALFQPLPVQDPDRLVWIRYTGTAGQLSGVPPRVLPAWRANSSLVAGIASYWHRPYAAHARVTANFFSLLGTKAARGRLFEPDDRDVAVLTSAAGRTVFGADAAVLGRQITVEGRAYRVIGVLPDSFWAISPRVGIWVPLHLEPQVDPGTPVLVKAVGRLKPGVQMEKVRTDLFQAAKAGNQFLPRRPEVVPFTAVTGPQLPGYLFGIVFAIGVGAVITALQQPFRILQGWSYGRFLTAKTLLLVAIPALGWVETNSAIHKLGPPDAPEIWLAATLSTIVFLPACAFAFWWSFADQRRRCPQCLQLLAMPITIGSWSSVLDPVTTEFLCESGHGSLYLPETEQGEPDHWTALDPSWRELFEKVTPTSS
jgi:hypothetical protein